MDFIAFDFETVKFSPGRMAPPVVCMTTSDGDFTEIYDKEDSHSKFSSLITNKNLGLIGASTSFDMAVAMANWPELTQDIFQAYEDGRVFDIQIREKLFDIAEGKYRKRGGFSLADISKRRLGIEVQKEDTYRLRYHELFYTPIEEWPEEAKEYALNDALITYQVFVAQKEEEDAKELFLDEPPQTRADLGLRLMSNWGIRTDRGSVEKLKAWVEGSQAELERELVQAGVLARNKKGTLTKKVRQVQALMLKAMGDNYERTRLTKKGYELKKKGKEWKDPKYVCVDAESCGDANDPLLEKYSRYSKLGTLLAKSIKAMEEGVETPLHSRFEVLLSTGRTSSSGPNIQNIRREPGARECFVPRKGNIFIACDYDKAELHTLSEACLLFTGASVLGETLNKGIDPHLSMGAQLMGVTYEMAVTLMEHKDLVIKMWRQRSKPFNFGCPGGMGWKGMQKYAKSGYGVILSDEEAQKLYKAWKKAWPQIVKYLKRISKILDHKEFVVLPSGRIHGILGYTNTANLYFQGTAADGAKRAMFQIVKACYSEPSSPLYGYRLVNFIHDEFILEGPEAGANAAAWELRDIMVREFNHFVPNYPVSATPAIMDVWSKDAETIINEAGELEVWRHNAA